jgi:beta-mannosidase
MAENKLIALEWRVGPAQAANALPQEMAKATVPGAANLDWANAKGMPDWRRDTNFTAFGWMEDVYWVYQADLPQVPLAPGQSLWLISGGVDYQYDVFVGEELRYSHEGMFKPFELNVANDMGKALRIAAYPAPKDPQGEKGSRSEAAQCVKPAVSYGWDWHPRLIPVGIWEDTGLVIREKSFIKSAEALTP